MVHVRHGKTKIYLDTTQFHYLKCTSFLLNIRVCTRLFFNVASPVMEVVLLHSGGCTPRATRAMARGSAQKIAEEVQKIVEEE